MNEEGNEKKEDILDSILNTKEEIENAVELIPNKTSDEYEYAKDNIRSIIDKGMIALDDLLAIARDSGHPKAYEAITELVAVMTKANLDLMEAKEINSKIQGVEGRDKTINNTLIVTTSEMQRILEEERQKIAATLPEKTTT